MARKVEAEYLLRSGLIPSEIAKEMRISVGSVIQYLRTRIGDGALRLSEIYFSFPAEKREALKKASDTKQARGRMPRSFLKKNGLTPEELKLYDDVCRRSAFAGDLYEHISETELALHDLVGATLKQAFGKEEGGWWRKGIPLAVRAKCEERRESDDQPCESAFQYTDLIELYEIMAKNWPQFQNKLPEEYRRDRTTLKKDVSRLNWIRNAVMHPVKRWRWSESDFQFAAKLRSTFEPYRSS